MKDPIVESLAKIRSLESKEILNEFITAPPGLAAAGKLGGKLLPGVGLALAAQDAYSRQKAGDTTGAAIAGLTGAASSIPVVGTAASLIGTGVQAVRDKMRTGSWMPDETEIAAGVAKDGTAQPAAAAPATAVAQAKPAAAPTTPAPPGADPKVIALQKQLIAKGAKITADGKMGPATQAAMKQFPGTAVAEQFKGTTMSEAQKIAELRDRLAQFESQAQVTDEAWGAAKNFVGGAADAVGNAFGAAKNFVGGVGKGIANPAATNLKNVAAGTTASTKGIKTGAAVARNPGKVAAGAAAAGAAGAAALSGGGATKPVTPPVKPPVKPAVTPPVTPPAPAQTPNAGADPADVAALNGMAAELENSQDPADIELMKRYNGIINAINNRGADDKRTQGEIAASAGLTDAGV
jgi:hypothetical protein